MDWLKIPVLLTRMESGDVCHNNGWKCPPVSWRNTFHSTKMVETSTGVLKNIHRCDWNCDSSLVCCNDWCQFGVSELSGTTINWLWFVKRSCFGCSDHGWKTSHQWSDGGLWLCSGLSCKATMTSTSWHDRQLITLHSFTEMPVIIWAGLVFSCWTSIVRKLKFLSLWTTPLNLHSRWNTLLSSSFAF